ncbi:MAG: hypothetical protein NTZ10_04480 [Candidatus Saganbacteria bacterium]|nr:hypothetical protein [Candidatus Saganbacteria bacterium]
MSAKISLIQEGFPVSPALKPQLKCLRMNGMNVVIAPNRRVMGEAAAFALQHFVDLHLTRHVSWAGIFAAAPSQDDVYSSLVGNKAFPWGSMRAAFQMDEYATLPPTDKKSFRWYHNTHLWGELSSQGRAIDPAKISQIKGENPDPSSMARIYASLLKSSRPEFVQGGFGEVNAHIAFNDPPLAKFEDPELVKVIDIAPEAKAQQVAEGHYKRPEDVPLALTLTIPALTRGIKYWSCVVPTERKALAVRNALFEPVSEKFPGSILRLAGTSRYELERMTSCLFLEPGSASLIKDDVDAFYRTVVAQ